MAITQTAFYSAANSAHFPGVVALLNSLRLVGHEEPMVLVDAGLTEEQRERLAPHLRLVPAPQGVPSVFLAPYGPILEPAEIAVVLDADIIVTRSLSERLAGQLVIPPAIGARIYGPWTSGQAAIGLAVSRYGKPPPRYFRRLLVQSATLDDPFYFADQDVLNAVLAAELEDDEIVILEHRLVLHPPFKGLELVDEAGLVCRFSDGVEPFLLHHIMGKPWLEATAANVYSRLLSRLLLDPDVAVRLEPHELPLRLRGGALERADRRRARPHTRRSRPGCELTPRGESRRQGPQARRASSSCTAIRLGRARSRPR